MSTSVDNRVVRLQFDNAQFEKETARSMSTLDKLKEKLNFSDSAKEFDKLQTSVNNVDFSAMEKSLKFLEDRFSATGEFVYKIWDKITDKAINSFRSIEQMTVGQIKSGGWSRAMNLANAQFQVEGLKYSWEKIFAAADYGVTDTAYGLDAAAKAASQLAASGVDFQKTLKTVDGVQLTQMHKSLRAISGLAAMTNSSYEEISHIFTRIAGTGRVFAIDLNSIAARGINATATLAKHLKTTEANVKDMVTKGQIDFKTFAEAMDEAYGEHAKEANNTFTGALSNMRAALSRIGAIFAQPVINKTNKFFNAITGKIKEVQKALSDVKDAEGKVNPKFATHFAEAWDAAVDAAVNFTNTINLTWIKSIADTMDRAAIKMKNFFDYINEGFKASAEETKEAQKETKEDLKNMVATQEEYNAAMTILFKDRSLSGKKRVQWLEKQGLNPKRVQTYIDSVVAAGYNVKKASIKVEQGVKNDKDAVESLDEAVAKLPITFEKFASMNTQEQKYWLENNKEVAKAYTHYNEWLGELMEKQDDARARTEAYNKVNEEYAKILGKLPSELKLDFNSMSDEDRAKIYKDYPQLFRVFTDGFKQAKEEPKKFAAVMEVLRNVGASIANMFKNVKTATDSVKMAFKDVFTSTEALDGLAQFTGKFREMTEAIMITSGGADKIRTVFGVFFKIVRSGIALVGKLAMKFMDLVIYVANFIKETDDANESIEETSGIFSNLLRIFKEIGRGIYNVITHIGELGTKIKNTDGVQRLIKAFTKLKDLFISSTEKAIKPAEKEIDKFSKKFKFPTLDDIANAIGWIADKIAWLIERIPVAIGVIKSVFSTIYSYIKKGWDFIKTFFGDDVASGSKSFFEGVRDGLIGAWEWTTDIAKKIGNFFGKLWDYIKTFVGGIDMDTVKKVGQFALVMAAIYEVLNIADSSATLIRNVADVPKSISKFIGGMTDAVSGFSKGWKYFGMAAIINALSAFFGTMTALIAVLALMPEAAMYRAIGAVAIIGLLVGSIMKAIAVIVSEKNTQQQIKQISNVKITVIGLVGQMAMVIGAVALAARWIVGALDDLLKATDNRSGVQIFWCGVMLAGIMVAVFAMASYIAKTVSEMGSEREEAMKGLKENKVGSELLGMAALFVGLGLAIKMVVKSINLLAGSIDDNGYWKVIAATGLVAAVMLAMAIAMKGIFKGITEMMKAADGSTGQMIAAIILVAVMGVLISAIIGELTVIAALPARLFNWERVLQTISLIGGILVAIGTAMALVGLGVHLMTKNSEGSTLIDAAIVMGVMFLGVELILKRIAEFLRALGGLDLNQTKDIIYGLIMTLGVIFAGMVALIGVMGLLIAKSNGALDSGDMVLLAGSVVILAAAFLVFAKAMQEMSKVDLSITQIGLLIGFVAVLSGLGLLVGKVKGFADGIVALGTALLLAGAGFYLFAHAGEPLAKALVYIAQGLAALEKAISWKLIAFMAALAVALLAIAKVIKPIADGIGKGIGSIGTSLTKAFGKDENGEGGIFSAILKNVKGFLKNFKKDVLTPIGTGIKNIFTGENGIITKLKNGLTKVKNWFNGLSDKTKKTVLAVIGGILMALETAAPDAVKSFIKVLMDVIDSIMEHAGYIVDRLVKLIVVVIISLAKAISDNAHIIGNAIKAVLYAILSIVLEAINIVFGWIPGLGAWLESGQKEASEQIDKLTEDTKKWIDATDKQREANEGMFGSTSTLTSLIGDYAEKLGFAKKNVEELTDAEKTRAQEVSGRLSLTNVAQNFDWGSVNNEDLNKNEQAIKKTIEDLIKSENFEDLNNYIYANYDAVTALLDKLEKIDTSKLDEKWAAYEEKWKKQGFTQAYFDEQSTEEIKHRSEASKEYQKAYSEYLSLIEQDTALREKEYSILGRNMEIKGDEKYQALKESYAHIRALERVEEYHGIKAVGMSQAEFDVRMREDTAFMDAYVNEYSAIVDHYTDTWAVEMIAKINKKKEKDEELKVALEEQEETEQQLVEFFTNTKNKKRESFTDVLHGGGIGIQSAYLGKNIAELFVGGKEEIFAPEDIEKIKTTIEEGTKVYGSAIIGAASAGFKSAVSPNDTAKMTKALTDTMTESVTEETKKILEINGDTRNAYSEKFEKYGIASLAGYTKGLDDPESINALRQKIDWITDEEITGRYEKNLGIRSPSKVMAEKGKFTILGLIKGLTDQTDSLDTTTEGIATGLVNAFQNPFDTIAKIASGEIPYNPSIQPVLDTGYLATGVNGINSMFQSQQVELSGYSGQLAADISGVANQNDAIVAQLAQLREDMNDMTETILGMQIVLDSGAVVGELSDGFDYSLGVASTRKKRGN